MKARFKKLFYKTVGSTNDAIKDHLQEIQGDYVVISYHQTSGRGKDGRIWHTKAGKGIGMSFLIREPKLETVSHFTALAAIAVVRMLKKLGVESKIKWPNDILVNGKKICGILCESSISKRKASYVIVGVGLNVNYTETDFPSLSTEPTSLYMELGKEMDIDMLSTTITDAFTGVISEFEEGKSLHSELVEYSNIIGKYCKFKQNNNYYTAIVKSINLDNSLNISENGTEKTIFSAEIIQIS